MRWIIFGLALFFAGCDGNTDASLVVNAPKQAESKPSEPAKKEEEEQEEGLDKDGCCKQVKGD